MIDQLDFLFGETFLNEPTCYLCALGDVDKPSVTHRRRVNGESSPAAAPVYAALLIIRIQHLVSVSLVFTLDISVCQADQTAFQKKSLVRFIARLRHAVISKSSEIAV